jgi:prolyl-tRNA editing enzyme YbaK/EbsC (Cys-tRNA(Pro) deacylase)
MATEELTRALDEEGAVYDLLPHAHSRVAARETVVLEAGSHEQSVRIAGADLVRAAGAQVAEICREED